MSLRQDVSGRALLMPSIRGNNDDAFNLPRLQKNSYKGSTTVVQQSAQAVPMVTTTGQTHVLTTRDHQSPRMDHIEGRLMAQEHRTATLLDRALRVKQEVVDAIGVAQGTWQQERQARELLQEHIRSITAVVNQLHHDLASLASQIQGRDVAIAQGGHAVKSIETHYTTAVSDLRNRVARGDASLAKLAADVASLHDMMKQQGSGQLGVSHRMADQANALEAKLAQLAGQMDRMAGESAIKLRFVDGDAGKLMAMVDMRFKALSDELKNALANAQVMNAGEREKLEGRILAFIERALGARDMRMDKLEESCLNIVNGHADRLDKVENEQRYLRDALARLEALLLALQANRPMPMQPIVQGAGPSTSTTTILNGSTIPQDFERYFVDLLERGLNKLRHDLEKLKREVREGFLTVHETITNLNKMIEAKRCLLEEQLRKELAHLRKMVVLI